MGIFPSFIFDPNSPRPSSCLVLIPFVGKTVSSCPHSLQFPPSLAATRHLPMPDKTWRWFTPHANEA